MNRFEEADSLTASLPRSVADADSQPTNKRSAEEAELELGFKTTGDLEDDMAFEETLDVVKMDLEDIQREKLLQHPWHDFVTRVNGTHGISSNNSELGFTTSGSKMLIQRAIEGLESIHALKRDLNRLTVVPQTQQRATKLDEEGNDVIQAMKADFDGLQRRAREWKNLHSGSVMKMLTFWEDKLPDVVNAALWTQWFSDVSLAEEEHSEFSRWIDKGGPDAPTWVSQLHDHKLMEEKTPEGLAISFFLRELFPLTGDTFDFRYIYPSLRNRQFDYDPTPKNSTLNSYLFDGVSYPGHNVTSGNSLHAPPSSTPLSRRWDRFHTTPIHINDHVFDHHAHPSTQQPVFEKEKDFHRARSEARVRLQNNPLRLKEKFQETITADGFLKDTTPPFTKSVFAQYGKRVAYALVRNAIPMAQTVLLGLTLASDDNAAGFVTFHKILNIANQAIQMTVPPLDDIMTRAGLSSAVTAKTAVRSIRDSIQPLQDLHNTLTIDTDLLKETDTAKKIIDYVSDPAQHTDMHFENFPNLREFAGFLRSQANNERFLSDVDRWLELFEALWPIASDKFAWDEAARESDARTISVTLRYHEYYEAKMKELLLELKRKKQRLDTEVQQTQVAEKRVQDSKRVIEQRIDQQNQEFTDIARRIAEGDGIEVDANIRQAASLAFVTLKAARHEFSVLQKPENIILSDNEEVVSIFAAMTAHLYQKNRLLGPVSGYNQNAHYPRAKTEMASYAVMLARYRPAGKLPGSDGYRFLSRDGSSSAPSFYF